MIQAPGCIELDSAAARYKYAERSIGRHGQVGHHCLKVLCRGQTCKGEGVAERELGHAGRVVVKHGGPVDNASGLLSMPVVSQAAITTARITEDRPDSVAASSLTRAWHTRAHCSRWSQ